MLVLTRKVGESIDIGGGVLAVTVLKVSGKNVRLGVDAPREVPVHRREVRKRLEQEQAAAEEAAELDIEAQQRGVET